MYYINGKQDRCLQLDDILNISDKLIESYTSNYIGLQSHVKS